MKLSLLVVLIAIVAVAFAKIETGGRLVPRPRIREEYAGVDRVATSTRASSPSSQRLVAQQSSNVVGIWNGPACILGGLLAHLTLGTLYCWGNFLSYAPAHLRFFDGLEHPGAQPDALYVIPFTIIAQAMAIPFGPGLSKALGASRAMLFGSWLTAAAVYLASYQKTLSSFMLFYSLMFGAGAGLAYTAPMAAGWKWLPANKGLVSGAILAGFGSGGLLFSMIGSRHVNPDGLNMVDGKFPSVVYERFPSMLRKLAIMYAVLSFVGSLLVTEPNVVQGVVHAVAPGVLGAATSTSDNEHGPLSKLPPPVQIQIRRLLNRIPDLVDRLPPPAQKFLVETVRLPYAVRKQRVALTTLGEPAPTPLGTGLYSPRGLTLTQALATKQFWLMWTLIITCATAGLNTAAVYKQFAATSPALTGDEFQALVGGIGALFNGVGRIFWGSISDRLGFKSSFAVLSVLQAVSMLTYTASAQSKTLFAVNTCSLFFTLAGNFALFPPAAQRMFGPEAGTVIYGVLYSAFAFASVFGGILTKALVKAVGWEQVFRVMAAMSLVATGLVQLVKPIDGFVGSVV